MKSTKERSGSIPKENPPSPARVGGKKPGKVCKLFTTPCPKFSRNVEDEQASVCTGSTQSSACSSVCYDYPDLQYKRPKRIFKNEEEKVKFVSSYVTKLKTEMCKNWEAYGTCRYKDKCCFAHGAAELRVKTNLTHTFKTKQCAKFQETKFCSYGCRCQYIHNPLTLEMQKDYSYTKMLQINESYCKLRNESLSNPNNPTTEELNYISAFSRRRLNIFRQLAG